MTNQLNYAERDMLKTILRFHGVADVEKLGEHLEVFAEWIAENQLTLLCRHGNQPRLPLVVLSQMGIYGKDALTPTRTPACAHCGQSAR